MPPQQSIREKMSVILQRLKQIRPSFVPQQFAASLARLMLSQSEQNEKPGTRQLAIIVNFLPRSRRFDQLGGLMKSLRSILFVLAAILIVPAVRAQQNGVKADIPFDFVVGDRAYPAGEYILRAALNDSGVIRIENVQEVSAAFASSHACSKALPSTETKLVFHRMGGNYFLYQVWTAGNSAGREFPKGRIEVQMAQNHETPEVVIVAALISR
jgi:hypothetical protein